MNKNIKRVLLRSSFLIVAFLFVLCSNINAQTTIDLTSHVTSTPPTGVILEWHNGTPASAATKLSSSQVVAAPAGTYYAVYHDTINNCYSPESRVVAASNNCPATTVDLTTRASNAPPAAFVQWYTNNAHTGTAYANPQTATSGTYYAFYYDSVNTCYSPASDPVIVFTGSCATPDSVEITPPCIGCPVTACVVADDIDTTGGGVNYTACSAPVGYTQTGPDANGCVSLTPNVGTTTGGQSCVVACKNGVCDTTYINVLPPVTPDTAQITPPCIGCPVIACVVADDIDTMGGGTSYTACAAPVGYTQTGPDANGCVTITANPGTTTGGQSCVVACKNGICDTTYIDVLPPVTPDSAQVTPPCIGCPVTACVVSDDLTPGGQTYTVCSAPVGYTQTGPDANGCVTITANPGTTTGGQSCVVACKNGICDTTYIDVLPPVTPDSAQVTPPCIGCPVTACVVSDDLTPGGQTYTACSAPVGYTQTGPDANGCVTITANPGTTTGGQSCVVACKNGVCDTTYIDVLPPVTPDTNTVVPPCVGCPVTACVLADDLTPGGQTYTACSAPVGYTQTGPDANGCVTITANPGTTTGGQSCVVACKNGICDTTYIDVLPPVTPDTNTVVPPCVGCPVTACVLADDLTPGGQTYTACSAPVGYTQTGPDANGCVTITANPGTTTGGQSCVVACKNGICDTTYIDVLPPVTPDSVQVTPPCIGCPVTACVVADDLTPGGQTYTACSAPVGYTQTGPDANGCVTITANPGTTTGGQSCVVACKNGVCDTTYIDVLPPVTPDTLMTKSQCDTCATVVVCATANDLPSGSGTISYSSCGVNPSGFGAQVLDTLTGCLTFTGNGTQGINDTLSTCIIACKGGICDTSYISILPPVISDSIRTSLPSCGTCPTSPICPSSDDLMTNNGITYTNCGLDSNELLQGSLSMDSNGCVVWTPNGNQVDTITSCIIACAGGLCDTTYVLIPSTLSVLPIELNDFIVMADDCAARLNWSTLSEQNTSYFNILRKAPHDLDFSVIGRTEAAGNSTDFRRYQFIDEGLDNGTYLYKIQTVDFDNSLSETITRSVRFNCKSNIVSVYPNPASEELSIKINSSSQMRFEIKLSDLTGRTIEQKTAAVDGTKTVPFSTSSLADGIYQIIISNGVTPPEVFQVRITH